MRACVCMCLCALRIVSTDMILRFISPYCNYSLLWCVFLLLFFVILLLIILLYCIPGTGRLIPQTQTAAHTIRTRLRRHSLFYCTVFQVLAPSLHSHRHLHRRSEPGSDDTRYAVVLYSRYRFPTHPQTLHRRSEPGSDDTHYSIVLYSRYWPLP